MKLPSTLSVLPGAKTSAKDVRLPKGVMLADAARDALIVLSPKATTFADAVSELPSPTTSAAFARVFVHPEAAREEGMLAKLKPRRVVPLAVRASALLARGYTRIDATDIDGQEWVSASPP